MQTSFNTPAPQSMIELYMELDAISWYYKFLAGIANWSMLAGFMIFPNAFCSDCTDFRIQQSSSQAVAICLLVFGYILAGLLFWRFKNLLFQVEAIFLPGFTISTIGFMNSLINVYGRKKPEWSSSATVATALSSVFIILYGSASLNASRSLNQIRKRDGYRKEPVEGQEDESLLTEEERTRRNLLSLLQSPQQQQEGLHNTGGHTYSPAFEHTYTPSAGPFSRIHRSRAYPSTPHMPGSSYSNTTYQMSSYQSAQPPVTPGTSQSNREGLTPSSSFESTGRWGISESAPSGGASTATSTFAPSRELLPQTPTQNSTSYTSAEMHPPDSGHIRDCEEKEAIRGPPRRKSIFAGISATVGHGKERVGAGWASWSRS